MGKRGWIAAALALAALAGGCQTTKSLWMRADGAAANPQQFELDKVVCEGEVARAGLSSNGYCRGIGGCVATGIVQGIQLNQVRQGCMAAHGYVLRQVTVDTSAPPEAPPPMEGQPMQVSAQ